MLHVQKYTEREIDVQLKVRTTKTNKDSENLTLNCYVHSIGGEIGVFMNI